jgi:hypothetical protein
MPQKTFLSSLINPTSERIANYNCSSNMTQKCMLNSFGLTAPGSQANAGWPYICWPTDVNGQTFNVCSRCVGPYFSYTNSSGKNISACITMYANVYTASCGNNSFDVVCGANSGNPPVASTATLRTSNGLQFQTSNPNTGDKSIINVTSTPFKGQANSGELGSGCNFSAYFPKPNNITAYFTQGC